MKSDTHRNINILGAIVGIVFTAACLMSSDASKSIKRLLISLWVVVPPIYFYLEWTWLYRENSEYPLEKFQYSQKLAKDVWLAITAILAAIYFEGTSIAHT